MSAWLRVLQKLMEDKIAYFNAKNSMNFLKYLFACKVIKYNYQLLLQNTICVQTD